MGISNMNGPATYGPYWAWDQKHVLGMQVETYHNLVVHPRYVAPGVIEYLFTRLTTAISWNTETRSITITYRGYGLAFFLEQLRYAGRPVVPR
jgi:hypothetical protein